MSRNDLTGRRFGYLTVLKFDHRGTEKSPRAYWLCKCDCEKEVVRNTHQLVTYTRCGHIPSCGCMTKPQSREHHITHGMSFTPIHEAWTSMKDRCYRKRYHNYERYGGRGITVCDRWRTSFENFYEDMSPTWKPGLTLDRINNDGNYEPANCRWATRKEQNNNQERTIRINGIPLQEFAREHGINPSTLYTRIRKGVPVEKLAIPPSKNNRIFKEKQSATEPAA